MKRFLCVLVVLVLVFSTANSIADGEKVGLGDLGISFSVDSKYMIITSEEKDAYSQAIQQSFGNRRGVMAYADNYAVVLVIYDQGKDIAPYDFRNKKADELPYLYDKMLPLDEAAAAYGKYDLSVYDSGKAKWRVVYFKQVNMAMYGTVYGQKLVVATFKMVKWDDREVEKIIDSFEFEP